MTALEWVALVILGIAVAALAILNLVAIAESLFRILDNVFSHERKKPDDNKRP
jgi:hypothetical protein